jgi:hypothetical protein
MESLLICGGCRSRFDLGKKSAKILPCFCTLCLSCLEENKNESSEYVIKCNSCKKNHHLLNLNTILTSKIINHFLEKSSQSTNSIKNDKQMLESFSESLAQRINTQICETSKHYESTLRHIENRAEKLIEVSIRKIIGLSKGSSTGSKLVLWFEDQLQFNTLKPEKYFFNPVD